MTEPVAITGNQAYLAQGLQLKIMQVISKKNGIMSLLQLLLLLLRMGRPTFLTPLTSQQVVQCSRTRPQARRFNEGRQRGFWQNPPTWTAFREAA